MVNMSCLSARRAYAHPHVTHRETNINFGRGARSIHCDGTIARVDDQFCEVSTPSSTMSIAENRSDRRVD